MQRNSIIKGYWDTKEIYIDGIRLDPSKSQKVYNHSPDGYNWNYGGSGPGQLSLALLLETVTEKEAVKYYQDFKWDIIAPLSPKDFEIKAEVIYNWLDNKRKAS